ncbi:glycoprotein [Rhodococcus spelaei]|uniref:Glycoprotein n=1 Tax=Rhodococcus spelaei TaxID=2546320 RepID=A0A541BQT1_9NOCA|nr:glycoprotein [Rhodococcus spelaei]TQF74679.1 glycoprotein [Rhodococcus spelaei]
MRTFLRRLTVTTLTTLALAAAPPGLLASVGAAPTTTAPDPGSSTPATGRTSVPHATTGPTQQRFVALSVDSVTPSAVTTSSDPVVTVVGSVSNVGDRPIRDVQVRLQRARAVSAPDQLRTVLSAGQEQFDVIGKFALIREKLEVGQSEKFTLSMPLRAATGSSLGITDPGVYPMLVNVNGTPEYGGQARLDDARFLLPVLGVPRDTSGGGDPNRSDAAPVPPSTADPVAVTLMWPLADKPRLAAGIPGSTDEKVRLVDDDLATSLASGGRLEQLVAAAEFATGDGVDRDHKLADSMCLAIDPDLLITVGNMSGGYLVVDDPADPTGRTHPGTGQAAAGDWLNRLRKLAAHMCTTAVPFAQVDLAALHRVGDQTLTARAVTAPADIVDTLLGITSLRGLTWPDAGVLDPATAAALPGLGPTTLLAANAVADSTTQPKVPLTGGNNGGPLNAALFDVSAATALAAVGASPQTPTFAPEHGRYDLTDDSRTARLQDALGAVTWTSLTTRSTQTRLANANPRPLLLVPPQQWTVDGDEARAVLSTVSTMLRSGLATPRALSELVDRAVPPPPFDLAYPEQAVKDGAPTSVQDGSAAEAPEIDALTATLVNDPQSALTPIRYTAPLSEDLLRAMSTSGRRSGDRSPAAAAAGLRVAQVQAALGRIYGSVTVLAPGGAYTLASEQSPLLFVARNDLPVGITVRLRISAPPEMTITDIGDQQLPARGSRALQVPAKVADTGKMVINVALTTTNDRELGEPASVSVRSNAYGKLLVIITGGAGALLLLLAGRRLWHRFRGQPDPADEGYSGR